MQVQNETTNLPSGALAPLERSVGNWDGFVRVSRFSKATPARFNKRRLLGRVTFEDDQCWGEAAGLTAAGAVVAGAVTGTITCFVTATWRAT